MKEQLQHHLMAIVNVIFLVLLMIALYIIWTQQSKINTLYNRVNHLEKSIESCENGVRTIDQEFHSLSFYDNRDSVSLHDHKIMLQMQETIDSIIAVPVIGR